MGGGGGGQLVPKNFEVFPCSVNTCKQTFTKQQKLLLVEEHMHEMYSFPLTILST